MYELSFTATHSTNPIRFYLVLALRQKIRPRTQALIS